MYMAARMLVKDFPASILFGEQRRSLLSLSLRKVLIMKKSGASFANEIMENKVLPCWFSCAITNEIFLGMHHAFSCPADCLCKQKMPYFFF